MYDQFYLIANSNRPRMVLTDGPAGGSHSGSTKARPSRKREGSIIDSITASILTGGGRIHIGRKRTIQQGFEF
jgi:hypothetical protein